MLIVAMLALSGCIQLPGAVQSPPSDPTPTPTGEATTPSSSPTTPSTEPSAPAQPEYEYVTGEGASTVWSFEPTHAEVVESDFDGTPADPGHRLIVLYIDGQLLEGQGNFYWDFRVGTIDAEEDYQFIGLSSGTDFYANNDLFTAGQLPHFHDAAAIYQVPEDWPLGLWRFTFHETGEQWIIEVPVDGA